MSQSRVLLLDVMGTLVHDPFYREIPEFFGMSLAELIEAKHPSTWVEFELGQIDETELARRFFADERPIDLPKLEATLLQAYRFIDGVEPVLERLRRRGVAMHALSNYSPWYRLIEASVGLSRYLSWSFVSCDTGVRKPDPRAYQGAAEALALPPSACVFVDDRVINCQAAEAMGMTSLQFFDAATLADALAGLDLL